MKKLKFVILTIIVVLLLSSVAQAIEIERIVSSGVCRAWKYYDSAGNVVRIDLHADAAITDYGNAATTGSIAWALATLTAKGTVHLNPGNYVLTTGVTVGGGKVLQGAGVDSTKISANTADAATNVITLGDDYAGVEKLWIYMPAAFSGSAVRTYMLVDGPKKTTIRDIYITDAGTAGTGWGIDIGNAYQGEISNIKMSIHANGLQFAETKDNSNVGDCLIENIDISLSSAGKVGMKFLGSVTGPKTTNNILINRFEITGTGGATDWQVGVWVQNASRLTFLHGDIESINYGVLELAEVGSGGPTVNNQNVFNFIHFIPAAVQTEALSYVRGAPLQAQHNTATATFVIRSGWVTPLGLAEGKALTISADNLSTYSRTIASGGIEEDTPSAGLTTITTTANLNMTLPTTKHPFMSIGTALPIATKIFGGYNFIPIAKGFGSSLPVTFPEINNSITGTTLNADAVSRTVINSYGRSGAVTTTLPLAAAGYSFIIVVGTQHDSAWKIQRSEPNTIYWDADGTITAGKTYFQETNQSIGSRVSCSTFQTGASAYSWLCYKVSGTWVTD